MWNKLRNALNYKYPDLSYILLPRAQGDGYCHYHILLNQYIQKNYIKEKLEKYDMGFFRIKQNKNVAEYLCMDYFKDSEYYLPERIRHHCSSRNIKLKNYKIDKNDFLKFNNNMNYKEIEKEIKDRCLVNYDWIEHSIEKNIRDNKRNYDLIEQFIEKEIRNNYKRDNIMMMDYA